MAAPNPNDVKKLNDLLEQQLNSLNNINKQEAERIIRVQQIANLQKAIAEHQKEFINGNTASEAAIIELQKELNKLIVEEQNINAQLNKQIKHRENIINLSKQLTTQLKLGWKYLQDQDKIIKSTILNLGMSQAKAVAMRDAFEKSAGYVTRLGGTITDIQSVMQGYADETGRARVMTAEMVKDITAIGKGTGLGIEQATKLGAQFEFMGFDAKSTMDYVQGVLDTSERMGVNTTKVLKNINDNFKRLNTYTFQQGVRGFAQMATYAEKFRIDINQALNAADVARSLEGAIDLTAQLQVMGGEFAKTDPFEMLFLSRNDPAKFTEKIADMTKGVVSFRKMADGSFEKFISPADRDRLAAVAKSMGMEASALTEIAERQTEIQKMRQQMAGLGLSKEQKEIIEGAAIFDKKSGKFQVQIGEQMKNIGELTKNQAKAFEIESKSLEERAKQAMTFDETFKATIETLKASLLPILKQVNWLLDNTIKPIADMAAKGWGVGGAAAALMSAGLLWKLVTNKLSNVVTKWVGKTGGRGMSGFAGRVVPSGAGDVGSVFTKTGKIRKGAGGLTAAQGTKTLGKGIGIGAAGAGIGAGVMLAANGVSQLADSLSKLTPEQAKTLKGIGMTLAITFPAAAIGIALAGAAATEGALGFLALGAAFVGIGFGINLATKGISKMAESIAVMNKSGSGAGKQLMGVAGGIGAITLAMTAGGGIATMFAINNSLSRMSKHSDNIEKIGTAFNNIKTVLSGSKDDFLAIEKAINSISNSNIKSGGYFSELATLLNKPLKVEFDKQKISLANDITLNIDGNKFMNKTYNVQLAIQKHEDLRNNKGS